MNSLKKILIGSFVVACGLGISSCGNDFLEEKLTTKLSTDYFDTPEGIQEMLVGLPQLLRIYNGNEIYSMNNYGTDEFEVGSDPGNVMWNNYSAGLQSTVSGTSGNRLKVEEAWDYLWVAINTHNIIIDRAETAFPSEAGRKQALGEAHFMRAWAYFYLTQQWGGVPLRLKPSAGIERYFERASLEECVNQIIADFEIAYEYLNSPASITPGKITKIAAAHFLAKSLLYRQSEVCAEFNNATKDKDLTKIVQLADEVIGQRALAQNFANLWDYKGPDGANELLPEVILSAQYTASTSGANGRFGNNSHMHFISLYQNWAGMNRDRAGEREYARMKTTNYAYDIYNRVNDSRFWKSFRTKQRVNYPSKKGSEALGLKFWQIGVMYVINTPDDADRFRVTPTITGGQPTNYKPVAGAVTPLVKMKDDNGSYTDILDPATGTKIPNVLPRYRVVDGYSSISTDNLEGDQCWASLSKYVDGSRADYNNANGWRDCIVARVGETYLIGAEALVRMGKYQEALDKYINPLRNRGAYKAGEDRKAYVDGGQAFNILIPNQTEATDKNRASTFCPENSYYESNNIPVTTNATDLTISSPGNLPAEDMAIITKLGLSSEFDKMLCLVLNERSRELMGEMIRWTDLSRTRTLVKRAKLFNSGVINEGTIQDFHMVRPIPQTFLEQLQNQDGTALTAAQINAIQNPGYN